MKALFLDRDGVINIDHGYVHTPDQFEFMPGIFDLLKHAKQKGYLLLLVTNQSGIGRGYYSEQDFYHLSNYMQTKLQEVLGFNLDRIYFCPHAPEEQCLCRKPKLGMLEQALKDFRLDLKQSIMLGDKYSDMQFSISAGIGTNLWLQASKEFEYTGFFSIETLKEAQDFLTPFNKD
ncbi:D-glycero-beta-D-manno-heptose 1,7-bisphosphate 7-phosphatase [Helicobacter suis]|uniref:D-glycero-beta-D-manno-heptose 1,7-bisphosphate 7-phosphatase n=2 Tax=Helicobacter suis TaxID=104628 RepID=UPI000CF02A94|nr:D-glycero-beta-D-manno-heptose 1,7-bisphosphate 7-phosphatase [Helicobacter suis]BCD48156.1 D,D-heptose 1,7-bisphosphate phosphatase GmhB [Helicobacter suis]GFK16020.1 D,D-heptose 1,7-bisphosphate phosphatase GmhB [Helicobacter suis]